MGEHPPAEQAKGGRWLSAAEVEQLRAALEVGLNTMEHEMPPAPNHSCGPESGCDGACMDFAYAVRNLTQVRLALAILESQGRP